MLHPKHVAYDENWKCAQRIWGAEVSSVICAKPQKLKMNVSPCQADCSTAPFYGVRWSLRLGSNLYNFIKMSFLILLPSCLFLNGVTQSVTALIIVYGCTCFFRKQSSSLFFWSEMSSVLAQYAPVTCNSFLLWQWTLLNEPDDEEEETYMATRPYLQRFIGKLLSISAGAQR